MEFRVLKYFLAVAREKSITNAAKKLHISQPTLSKQIKQLEAELGQKLFTRTNYSIRLTEAGLLLQKRAENIVALVDKTTQEFQDLDDVIGGDIHLGCAESIGMQYLARQFKELQSTYPGLRYHLYSGDSSDIALRLERGLLDFTVIVQEVDLQKYNYLKLPHYDTWGVLMPKDSPLAQHTVITVAELVDLPLIVSRQGMEADYPKFFGEKVDELNIVATSNLIYNASLLVREGLGYALTFDDLVDTSSDSELCFRPLRPNLTSNMYLIWNKHQVFSPAAKLLLDKLKEKLAQ